MSSNSTHVHQARNAQSHKTVHFCIFISTFLIVNLCIPVIISHCICTVHTHTLWDNDAAALDKFPFGDWTSVPSLVPPQQMSNHPNITAGTEQHSG